jgi:DNA-binding response OmpR family regulator
MKEIERSNQTRELTTIEYRMIALAAGANDYLTKPVSLKKMAALIEQYLLR